MARLDTHAVNRRWPHVIKPATIDNDHLLGGIDLAPTILEAAGLPNLKGTEGRSFLPLLRSQPQSGRDYVFTQIDQVASGASYPMRAVTDTRYGYIFNAWSDGKTEMRVESMQGLTFPAMREAASNDAAIAARVKHFVYRTREELYDYGSDPHALHNLADDGQHAERLATYRAVLLRHLTESAIRSVPPSRSSSPLCRLQRCDSTVAAGAHGRRRVLRREPRRVSGATLLRFDLCIARSPR